MLLPFVLTFIFVFMFQAGNHSEPFQLAPYALVLFATLACFNTFKQRKIQSISFISSYGMCFILVFSCTLFFSHMAGNYSETDFFLIIYSIFCCMVAKFVNEKEDLFLKSFIYVMLLSVPFSFYLFNVKEINLAFIVLKLEELWRFNSFFSVSTNFGIYLALSILMLFFLIFSKRISSIHILWVILLFIGSNLSGARTGLSALSISIFYIIVVYFFRNTFLKKSSIKYYYLLFVILFFGALSFYYIFVNFDSLPIKPGSSIHRLLTGDTNSLGGRTEKISIGIQLFNKVDLINQIFGSGSGSFSVALMNFNGTSPHSGMLRILYDYGIFSIFVITSMVLFLCAKSVVYFIKTGNNKVIFYSSIILFLYVCEFMIPALMSLTLEHFMFVYFLYACSKATSNLNDKI